MPWKESYIMDEKMSFITKVKEGEWNVIDLCEEYGISRTTGYKWLKRYEQQGIDGLKDLSRAPHNPAKKLDEAIIREFIQIKKKYLKWGPKKIRRKLIDFNPNWTTYPSASTIGEYLKKAGLVIPKMKRKRAVPTAGPLTQGLMPNDVWAVDFKGHFSTKGGKRCNPLTISDDLSRYLLYCDHLDSMDHDAVKEAFERTFTEYGLPLVIRSDNGTPFSARSRYGLSKLSFWWIRLGIHPERIEPGKPQQNGRHERMHLTLKKEATRPISNTLQEQRIRLLTFQKEYNEQRPHEALNFDSPAQHYYKSNRRFPTKIPTIEYPISMDKRKIQENGVIDFRGKRIFVSGSLVQEYIGLEQVSEQTSNLWYCNYNLGILDHVTGVIIPCKQKAFKNFTNNMISTV